jgi:hypothetical protein
MNLSGCAIACVFVLSWPSLCPPPCVSAVAGGAWTIYTLFAAHISLDIKSALLAGTATSPNRRNRNRTTIA